MYYWIQNSEDGVSVREFTRDALIEWIADVTGEHVIPAFRTQFTTDIPNEYTDTNHALIIKGKIVVPQPITRVTEYELE